MKLTRRQLAAALAAAAPLAAQPQQQPPEDPDAAARARVRNGAAAVNAVPVPMAVEPAFAFDVK